MKQHTLNADSWHFRLANYGKRRISDYTVRHGTDICTYTRSVIAGFGNLVLIVALASTLVSWLGYSLYDWTMFFFTEGRVPAIPSVMFAATLAALSILLCGALLFEGFRRLRRELMVGYYSRDKSGSWWKENQPGFLRLAYRKFKNKTCFRIRFED